MNAPQSLSVGLVLFEGVTQLDFTGPYEVFSRMPGAKVHLVAESTAPIRTEFGLMVSADTTFDAAPPLDVICVPGGWGVNAQLRNAALHEFLRLRAPSARYVTSVCTGALLLGAAGLLDGYRATTHWMSTEFLARFGATHVDERVVIDRNRITGGGVTAGIDLALVVAAEVYGAETSQAIQLAIEYQPAPPFNSGSPRFASPQARDRVLTAARSGLEARRMAVEQVAGRLRTASVDPAIRKG